MNLACISLRYIAAAAIALSLGICLLACTHQTVIVKEQDLLKPGTAATELLGIPFYSKRGVCTKESVWLEAQYTLLLTVAADQAAPTTRTMVLSRAGYLAPATQALLEKLTGLKGAYRLREIVPASCPAAIGEKWNLVAANPEYAVTVGLDSDAAKLRQAEARQNAILVSNDAEVGVVVDYTRRDYLNTVSPWNGSAQVDAKLAADGTLSEGSVQRDDETLSTVLTSIASLVGDFTGASAASTGTPATTTTVTPESSDPNAPRHGAASCPAYESWPAAVKEVKYTYSLKTAVYRHDHKEQSELTGPCSLAGDRVWGGNFVVSVEDGSSAGKKAGKAIEFSGQVALPESLDKKKGGKDTGRD